MGEIRREIVSGDWVIVAPERAKRPHGFLKKNKARKRGPKKGCPFEDGAREAAWPPMLQSPKKGEWRAVIVPNKYPALPHRDVCAAPIVHGPYEALTAVGSHELLITRDHNKNIADLTLAEGTQVFELLKERYLSLAQDSCLVYATSCFNWGPLAGASVYHPHYQILTLPIIPAHVRHSFYGSARYFKMHKRCPHCVMLAYEHKEKVRVIAEDKYAIAIAPYASRQAFEVRVYPKHHWPGLEHTPKKDIESVVAMLQVSMHRIKKYLNDPDLNFFVHSAPLKGKDNYPHYHWHIEITPHLSIGAGFEFSTHVQINMIDPDTAAQVLRGGKVTGVTR